MLVEISPILERFYKTPDPKYLDLRFQKMQRQRGLIKTVALNRPQLQALQERAKALKAQGSIEMWEALLVLLCEQKGTLISGRRLAVSIHAENNPQAVGYTLALATKLRPRLGDAVPVYRGAYKALGIGIKEVNLEPRSMILLHGLWNARLRRNLPSRLELRKHLDVHDYQADPNAFLGALWRMRRQLAQAQSGIEVDSIENHLMLRYTNS